MLDHLSVSLGRSEDEEMWALRISPLSLNAWVYLGIRVDSYITIAIISFSTFIFYIILLSNYHLYSKFFNWPQKCPFLTLFPPTAGSSLRLGTACSYHVSSLLWPGMVPQPCFVFDDIDILEYCSPPNFFFPSISFLCGLSDVFSWLYSRSEFQAHYHTSDILLRVSHWKLVISNCLLFVVLILTTGQVLSDFSTRTATFSPLLLISNQWGDTLTPSKSPAPRENIT